MEIMRDPVVAHDGFTCCPPPLAHCPLYMIHSPPPSLLCRCSYERASIEAWFALGKTSSPKTGAQLGSECMQRTRLNRCVLPSCAAFDAKCLLPMAALLSVTIAQVTCSSPTTTCARAYSSGKRARMAAVAPGGDCVFVTLRHQQVDSHPCAQSRWCAFHHMPCAFLVGVQHARPTLLTSPSTGHEL